MLNLSLLCRVVLLLWLTAKSLDYTLLRLNHDPNNTMGPYNSTALQHCSITYSDDLKTSETCVRDLVVKYYHVKMRVDVKIISATDFRSPSFVVKPVFGFCCPDQKYSSLQFH